MDTKTQTNIIRFGALIAGAVFLILSVYYMPKVGFYSQAEINMTTYISIITITVAIINMIINPKGYSKEIEANYRTLEKYKLVKVNNYALFAIAVLIGMVASAIFVHDKGDFQEFYMISTIVIFLLLGIQYWKAIPKLKR